jgi:hypothetical protein
MEGAAGSSASTDNSTPPTAKKRAAPHSTGRKVKRDEDEGQLDSSDEGSVAETPTKRAKTSAVKKTPRGRKAAATPAPAAKSASVVNIEDDDSEVKVGKQETEYDDGDGLKRRRR